MRLVTEELIEQGWDQGDAQEEARRRFGEIERVRRECEALARRRDSRIRRVRGWEGMMQDFRYAVRSLRRSPGFAVVALLTLALGIGANTAMFSVIEGVLIRPLPFPDSDRVVRIWERRNTGSRMDFSWPSYQDLARGAATLEAVAAVRPFTVTVLGGPEPQRLSAALASAGFWDVFPVTPVAGRLTRDVEHVEGAAPVLVMDEGLAVRMFGSPVAAVGRTVEAAGVLAQVVGVVPLEFDYPAGGELWIPLEQSGPNSSRTSHNEDVVARLADEVSLDAALGEADAIVAGATAGLPDDPDFLPVGVHMETLLDSEVGDNRSPLFILWGAAIFVLLVACTNLASTVLARGTIRARELAVRASLGATRWRIVRQLLAENFVLTGMGGLLGIAVGWMTLRLLRPLGAGSLPRITEVGLSPVVLSFTLLLAVATAVVFGVLPAMKLSSDRVTGALRSGERHTRGDARVWGSLVAAEVALALVLLIGSGLMLRSFATVTAQDPGVDPSDVTMASVSLSGGEYPDPSAYSRFWDRALPEVAGLPGVTAVGIMTARPVQGFIPTGRISIDAPENHINAPAYVVASPGAFEALDIPLVRGRIFDRTDGAESPHVVVVNQAFADEFSPDQEVLGRRVTGGGMDAFWDADPPVFATIVGVVGDVKHRSLTEPAPATIYWNYRQRPGRMSSAVLFIERVGSATSGVVAAARASLMRADPDLALEFSTLQDQVGETLRARMFVLAVLAVFSGLALLLSAVGIYGVVSYTTARRTREVGIRMALGAQATGVRSLVIRGAMLPVAIGIVTGVGASLLLSDLLESLLFEVSPVDPLTFIAVPLLLVGVGFLASWLPALRSSRISPTIAMRVE